MEQDHPYLILAVAAAAVAVPKLLGLVFAGWQPSPFVGRCLRFTPGTMLSALIVPDLLMQGSAGLLAAVATIGLAFATRSMVMTVIGGAAAAVLLRTVTS